MKGFLQEYGVIMVVVAVVLGMLAFGKTGYAKGIQDAILGSANHVVETGESVTKGSDVKSSDILNIEGKGYIVLEKQGNSQALVMTTSNIVKRNLQSKYDSNTGLRPDGQNASTYEDSEIDNYLENDWYNSLSSTMKAAIQSTNIKQASYSSSSPGAKQETGYNGQVYNTISRHAFLPSVSEIEKAVDLRNPEKIRAFLRSYDIWTRDSYQRNATFVECLTGGYDDLGGLFSGSVVGNTYNVRPAFVIDLSQVDYKVTDHVDYK